MGVMCVVWRYRLTLSIILALVVCGVYASDGGKVYPRGNHWAVGHLMGKKSIDDQGRFVERFIDQDDLDPGFLHSPAQLLKGRPEQMSAHGSALETSPLLRLLMANVRQWVEEQERERQLKQEEQIFLQALGMKDESS